MSRRSRSKRSGQELLRQRRTLIGQQCLVADQRDRPGVTALAQGLDCLRGGLSGADDDYPLSSLIPSTPYR